MVWTQGSAGWRAPAARARLAGAGLERGGGLTEDESIALLREETVAARAELEALRMDADRVSRSIETGLLRAVKTGRFGFEDLKRLISSITDQIARSALRGGMDVVLGRSGGLATFGAGLLQGALGLPGRATGGDANAGRSGDRHGRWPHDRFSSAQSLWRGRRAAPNITIR